MKALVGPANSGKSQWVLSQVADSLSNSRGAMLFVPSKYVMAASRVIEKESRVASAYYLHINSRKKGSELPSSKNESLTIEAIVELAERHIRNYVRQARSGVFPVKPNRGICPNYCEYDVMCRVQSLSGRIEDS